jgi:Protein of unknown function (DUF3800)
MYLLYLDESGNEKDPDDRFFVLGGIALFERQIFFLSQAIDQIQDKYFPNKQPIPFHASEIRSGRKFWRQVPDKTRDAVLSDLAEAIRNSPERGRALYAAAIEKSKELWGEDAVEKATEEICRRFDLRLKREYQNDNNPQRGLLIFSEGRFDARAKIWVRGFHQRGTRWGAINNLADIPYFAPMQESRLLQIADFVAHAVWLMYERRNSQLLAPLLRCFDVRDGVPHGLVHVRPTTAASCDCPACQPRRSPGDFGPWLQADAGDGKAPANPPGD